MLMYFVNETIKITAVGANDASKQFDERNKEVLFKNCAPLTEYKRNK